MTTTSQEDFFARFPDILAKNFGIRSDHDDSVDLDELCKSTVQPSQPCQIRPSVTSNKPLVDKVNLEELQFLYETISKNNSYSKKLAGIMLDQLKKKDIMMYERFINNKLDKNTWIPIVNINSSNTPYIEFLFKADESDVSPFDQLKQYTPCHLGYASSIINLIRGVIAPHKRKQQSTALVKSTSYRSSPKFSTPKKAPIPKAATNPKPKSTVRRSSALETSIRRIMPPRNCKS